MQIALRLNRTRADRRTYKLRRAPEVPGARRLIADPLNCDGLQLKLKPRRLAALLLAEIQAARLERAMGLWDATFPDDDTTTLPNPLDSAQSRRAMEVLL
jgi:hypothetical protein